MQKSNRLPKLSPDGNFIEVKNSLELPDLDPNNKLQKILAKSLSKVNIPIRGSSDCEMSFWRASHFQLDTCSIFLEAREEKQSEILRLCSTTILEETTTIEKLASCFTAKMALLAKTSEERMFYSLMAAEEVAHFHAMQSYLPDPLGTKFVNYPFALLLSEAIEKGGRASIIYIIQVVLEGWGLTHFKTLAEACVAEDLRATYRHMLHDEARHHGSGVLIFQEEELNTQEFEFIIEVLVQLLEMIAVGPIAVANTLEKVMGHFSPSQRNAVFRQLDAQAATQAKLDLLRTLMSNHHGKNIVEKLERYCAFTAWPSSKSASIPR